MKHSLRHLKKISGQANLIIILSLSALAFIVVGTFVQGAVSNYNIVLTSISGIRAYSTAQAGLERVISEWTVSHQPASGTIYQDVPLIDSNGDTVGTYTVVSSSTGNNTWQIDAIGASDNRFRQIQATVKIQPSGPREAFSKAIFTNSDLDLSGVDGIEFWGDIYVNGQVTWDAGGLEPTTATGTHFTSYQSDSNTAPYGRLEYYYFDADEIWQVTTGATTNGDARGFWSTSSQNIDRDNVWLNPLHNTGDSLYGDVGQYWNRNGGEYLKTDVEARYGQYTGIAVKNYQAPLFMPKLGNGTYAAFAGYYNSIGPSATKFSNIRITEEGSTSTILLSNGKNSSVIGTATNSNGYLTQFVWNGTSTRDNDSEYSGALLFDPGFVLYVDGDITINSGNLSNNVLTLVSSGDVTISQGVTLPSNNLAIIAFGDVTVNTTSTLNGVIYSRDTVTLGNAIDIYGSIVANKFTVSDASTTVTYHKNNTLTAGKWFPGGAPNTVDIINITEVAPN